MVTGARRCDRSTIDEVARRLYEAVTSRYGIPPWSRDRRGRPNPLVFYNAVRPVLVEACSRGIDIEAVEEWLDVEELDIEHRDAFLASLRRLLETKAPRPSITVVEDSVIGQAIQSLLEARRAALEALQQTTDPKEAEEIAREICSIEQQLRELGHRVADPACTEALAKAQRLEEKAPQPRRDFFEEALRYLFELGIPYFEAQSIAERCRYEEDYIACAKREAGADCVEPIYVPEEELMMTAKRALDDPDRIEELHQLIHRLRCLARTPEQAREMFRAELRRVMGRRPPPGIAPTPGVGIPRKIRPKLVDQLRRPIVEYVDEAGSYKIEYADEIVRRNPKLRDAVLRRDLEAIGRMLDEGLIARHEWAAAMLLISCFSRPDCEAQL